MLWPLVADREARAEDEAAVGCGACAHLAPVDLDSLADADEPVAAAVARRAAAAVVANFDLEVAAAVAEGYVGVAGVRMLERVRQPFLDDAVRREVDRARERDALAVDVQPDGQTGAADLRQQRIEAVEAGLGHELDVVSVAAHRSQEPAHLRECRAARPLDALERLAILGELVRKLVPDGADLEHHHADRMRDDVVELARDPGALLRDGEAGGRFALPLGLGRSQLCRLGLLGPLAEREAREPADPEHERDEDLFRRRVRGQVVDDHRRAADRDRCAPGHFLWDAKTADEQLRRYAALCAEDGSCSSRTGDLAASVHSAIDRMPGRWLFLPIKKGNIRAAASLGMANATPEGGGPLTGPLILDALLSADEGDAAGAWLTSVLVQAVVPRFQVAGDYAAMGLSDAAHARQFFASPADHASAFGSAATEFGWGGGRLVDSWPVTADHALYNNVPDSEVEPLLVGGELDLSTPPQVATRELLPHLPDGEEVVLPKLGHTEDFWAFQPQASTQLIETYLDRGTVDTSLYTENRVDFTPSLTYGAIAKIVLGVMLGLSALTVLSLAWMALGVRRHGAFGRRASGALRSVYALVLGLGGLLLGMLIALTALPTVPIGDELLTTLSIGVPVGVGLYLAWVSRDWSRSTRTMGFAAAAGGALLGAWLGFNATDGALPLLTAILGATVGGNLLVLALDIAWDWQARDRSAATKAEETLAAQPLAG